MTRANDRRLALVIAVLVGVGGCGGAASTTSPPAFLPPPQPTPTATPRPTSPVARNLNGPRRELRAGRWTRPGFVPRLTFAVDDGWAAVEVEGGYVEIARGRGKGAVTIAFARPDGIYRGPGQLLAPTTAEAAAAAVSENTALTVLGSSGSQIGGHSGLVLELEKAASASGDARVLHVPAGPILLEPGRRLWVAFIDAPEGLVAILVSASTAAWDEALATAEPILESVTIGI